MLAEKNVTVFMNTPLMQLEKTKLVTHRLKAKVIKDDTTGLLIDVVQTGDLKAWHDTKSVTGKVFIPSHKIDFVVME